MIGIKPPSKGRANSPSSKPIAVEFQVSRKHSSSFCWLAFCRQRERGRKRARETLRKWNYSNQITGNYMHDFLQVKIWFINLFFCALTSNLVSI